eukprot:1175689-Alexandrium_andersonii.AAC.1
MCRATTGRSEHEPLGALPRPEGVVQANILVARVALLLLWSMARRQTWILEQPANSIMMEHPRLIMAKHIARTDPAQAWHQVHTWMGAFGGKTGKPTRLWSNSEMVLSLKRKSTSAMRAAWDSTGVTSRGEDGGITGGPGLKGTQAYPIEYGRAVADALANKLESTQRNTNEGTGEDCDGSDGTASDPEDDWPDANLRPV